MKGLNQEQHIQLLQFMSLMQNCKTEEEMKELQEQYYNIPQYSFLQAYIPDRNENQSFSSYKTSLIYEMDKYNQDYKFVYGENVPAYRKESMPNSKANYTVLNLLDEINECNNLEEYQKLLNESNKLPKARIEALSSDYTGIYYSSGNKASGLPSYMIQNSPKSNFNSRKQLIEAGYSLFDLPSVEDVRENENGFDWLHEEISHFKELLNPNFIEMENQMNQEPALNENEYEEEFDDYIEQMDANGGMSSMAAEADYNAYYENYEDIEDVQRQMDMDNGLIDENGNEILYDVPESELVADDRKTVKAIDVWNEINDLILNDSDYGAKKFAALDYLYNRGVDDAAGYEDSFETNILRFEEFDKTDKRIAQIFEKYKEYKIDFDDQTLAVKIAGTNNGNYNMAKQEFLNFVENRKFMREAEIVQKQETSLSNSEQVEMSEDDYDKYIHSEEFISKFGDWEKANRLEKLKESESLIGSDSIVVEGVDVSDIVARLRANYSKENLKQLQELEKDIGNEVLSELRKKQNLSSYDSPILKNIDSGKTYKIQMQGIKEVGRHNLFQRGHLEAIRNIPDLIENSIFIGNEKNEDNRNPTLKEFYYFASGLKIDDEDYTAKIVFTLNDKGEFFYDQSLSNIEKGRLIDILQEKNRLETFNPKKSQDSNEPNSTFDNRPNLMREEKSNPPNYYDKRLISICQVPQMPYLEKNLVTGQWRPTKEAVEAVKNGTLFVEKQGQKYVMNDSIDKSKENEPEKQQNISENISTTVPVENTAPEPQSQITEESQNLNSEQKTAENNNSSYSVPRPKTTKELHQFFIENPYVAGTPVPKIAMRNELSGHSTFIEGYEFARFEDIGKPNPAFFEEDKKTGKLVRIKPDGQTVVLTKPGFKEEINKETGEKELVIDETKRKFIKISRDLYEQVICNSEIIAKRNPKTEQEHSQMIADYEEAAHLDEKKQRDNTASNFWHNYQAGVMTLANNKQEAMAFAKRLVNEMIPSEREKFANMVRKYENIKGADGKNLSYDQRILDTYKEITKGLTITNKSIWRDHVNDKYNTLDAIKQNTEVFDKEGQSLDKTCRMKIGDTIKMTVTVDSALSNKKIKLPPQEYRLVAHSKDNNSVALISVDGKQKIIKNREDFIKEVQKVEKRLIKKQQRQDRYESISM